MARSSCEAAGISPTAFCETGIILEGVSPWVKGTLSARCLNTLPPTLGLLTSLQRLDVANNKLTALPIEIGNLTKLEDLQVNNNRISSIPSSVGNCTSLIEVDLSSNHLSELPDEFCSLHNLKALHISNNAMKSLPNSLFTMCAQLSTLAVHNTEITTDTLLQCEGWEDFEERRHAECQRRREEHFNSAEFDELADTIFSDFLRNRDGCSARWLILALYRIFSLEHSVGNDLLVTGSNLAQVGEFKKAMHVEFEMTDLGKMAYFLGMEINQTPCGIFVNQKKYANEVLRKFSMESCKSMDIPLVQNQKLSKEYGAVKIDEGLYRSLIDHLLNLTVTIPDVMYATGLLSRFMSHLSEVHFKATKRVLRYVKGSTDFGVDLSSNYLSELPDEFYNLHNLKALDISNNAMKSLPNSLFRM
ncbi:uncharacterized protein LOC116130176 [Pistacia vera]|uniref:uncharacterized protein LOC116130176 n=1 Tax=Pistacia vera TaxID=55513 RepID=UPI001263AADA|nr:uncharacterized protein LOC116130176 [Pistacia vera]